MRAGSKYAAAGLASVCSIVIFNQETYAQSCAGCAQHNGSAGSICCQPGGPDVIVGDIQGISNYASASGYDAFSMGTTSCNLGNSNLQWQVFPSNLHPAIGQGLFKLKNGRIEQLGVSWLKHGFTALTENVCGCHAGSTTPGDCPCAGGSVLGIGCSDPYSSARNGSQSGLGPRWQVNADTGFFPLNGPANPAWSGTTARRLRVNHNDLEPSSASILYFTECQYVCQDDATANNQNNNASHRQITMTGSAATSFTGTLASTTQREKPAIMAWKANDPTVTEKQIQLLNEGLFIHSSKATDLGGGLWHYEYALQNVNSDRSVRGFTVALPEGAVITNIGFHDVEYHSGDGNGNVNFDGTDWPVTQTSTSITWATDTFLANNNANALRWGTMYNFRFDADVPPITGAIVVDTYKVVGTAGAVSVVPSVDCNDNNVADSTDISAGTSTDANANGIPDECEKPAPCDGDINADATVDVLDLLAVIGAWGNVGGIADLNGDNIVDVLDLLIVIGAWGDCPV